MSRATLRCLIPLVMAAGLWVLPAQASDLAERADTLILNMLGAVSAVRDYEARFVVQVTRNGELQKPDGLLIRQRRQPACMYTRWLEGARQTGERVFCSEAPLSDQPVRRSARTLVNRRALTQRQIEALKNVLSATRDDGLFGMVARYANQYFDAAENAEPGEFVVGLRQATVFKRPATCLRIRRRDPVEFAPFSSQSELCVDDQSKLPSALRQWNAQGALVESYLMGDYQLNTGLADALFTVRGQ